MANKEVVLLDFWGSLFGMRVRIALAEKGVDYEHKEEDLRSKSDFLLKVNPVHKKIPVLIHKDRPVCESLTIIEYIDEVWSQKSPLLPSDPYQRAHARFWADFIEKKIYLCGRRYVTSKGEEQEEAKKEFIECLKLLEQELGDKPYYGGDIIGFLDIAIVPFYCVFYAFETLDDFGIEASCPKIIEWAKRCMLRESVSKSLPDLNKFCDFILEIKNKFNAENEK